jgi:ATPase subunit of ABC transporter with duplicated ATPase domains
MYDEIRSHGVGYYGFSRDEEKRAEELKELRRLSEQMEVIRSRIEKERTSKESQMTKRLRKIQAKPRAKREVSAEQKIIEQDQLKTIPYRDVINA